MNATDDDEREERLALLRERIRSLRAQVVVLDRQYRAIPKLAPIVLLAIPVAFVYGLFEGFMAFFCAVGFLGVCLYIFGSRRAWYRREADQLEGELRRKEGP